MLTILGGLAVVKVGSNVNATAPQLSQSTLEVYLNVRQLTGGKLRIKRCHRNLKFVGKVLIEADSQRSSEWAFH